MPLTAKGKKLKKKFKEQYGKKKGEKVFYAMENSGKLKKVIKAVSGRDAGMGMGGKTGNYGGSSKSSSGGNGRDPSAQFKDLPKNYKTSKANKTALETQRQQARARISPSTTTAGKVAQYGAALAFGIPTQLTARAIDYSPLAFGVPKGTKKTKNTTPNDRDGGGQKIIQPVITPVQATKPVDTNLISPKDNFFNFVAYKTGGLSGGVRYGPPPKRGPNSQVPPVKMKKGGYKK